jgi:hypothetical protein
MNRIKTFVLTASFLTLTLSAFPHHAAATTTTTTASDSQAARKAGGTALVCLQFTQAILATQTLVSMLLP